MPIYLYHCSSCNTLKEEYKLVTDYVPFIDCNVCKGKMNIKITPPTIFVSNTEVKLAELEAKKNGSFIKEPGTAKEAKKNREYRIQKEKKRIREVVAETVRDYIV